MYALLNNDRVVEIKVCDIVRYYIANGHPGCNLPANNKLGWKSKKAAEAASLRCENAWRQGQ
jgi:hypothetical protein